MAMKVCNTIRQTREFLRAIHEGGKILGLVPTMGALHEGHLSLIRRCRAECDLAAVSIFVNPTQFGPSEDLDSYPRTLDADSEHCRRLGVDLIFAPTDKEMYPSANLTWINLDKLTEHLCGAARPLHFRGVCTVLAKLFNIIRPDIAYFGQKDAQQLAVLRRMVADLNVPVEIRTCPTIREPDGLALSSRNQYLTADQRRQATCLHRALSWAREMIAAGQTDSAPLIQTMQEIIAASPDVRIDYISIVDNDLLQPLSRVDRPALIALAVFFGNVRLIDNIDITPHTLK